MAAPNASNLDWADQVPIAAVPLNTVRYTGPPLDQSEQNVLLNHPGMVFLPEPTTVKELNKNGIVVSGSAARGLIGPLIGSFDIFDNDDGFLFRVSLPGVEKNEKFKCDVQENGTITINGATSSGGKKVHSHTMVFEMHSQNLCLPGDLSVSFQLPGHVDPLTLEHVLDNGVLEGVIKKKHV